jgi:hypothetical protein
MLAPLPTITLTRPEHVALNATVANGAALPTGSDLISGMVRWVSALSRYYRYDPDSLITVDGLPTGWVRHYTSGSQVYFGADTSASGYCDRPIDNLDSQYVLAAPAYAADGSTGTPVRLWLVNGRQEGGLPLVKGTRIDIIPYLDGENVGDALDGLLWVVPLGYARISDGGLDTAAIADIGSDYPLVNPSPLVLQKDLPSGYAFAVSVYPRFSAAQANGRVLSGQQLSVQMSVLPVAGVYDATGTVLGNFVTSGGGRRRVVTGLGLSLKALPGAGSISAYSFPEQPEQILVGLQANTSNHVVTISGARNGQCQIQAPGYSPTAVEAIRATVSTLPGLSEATDWVSITLAANQGIELEIYHPCDGNGLGTVRVDYPDIAAGSAGGDFNPTSLRIYLQVGSTVHQSSEIAILRQPTQTVALTELPPVGSLPIPTPDFSLYAPVSVVASAITGSLAAGTYNVAVAYEYDGNEATVITHSSQVYELSGTFAELFSHPEDYTNPHRTGFTTFTGLASNKTPEFVHQMLCRTDVSPNRLYRATGTTAGALAEVGGVGTGPGGGGTRPTEQLIDGTNIATDCSPGQDFAIVSYKVGILDDRTFDDPSNIVEGARYVWRIRAAGGDRTPTFAGAFNFGSQGAPGLITDNQTLVVECDGAVDELLCRFYEGYGAAVVLEPETVALLGRFVGTYGPSRQSGINTLIAALKTAGIWSTIDALYFWAAPVQDDALLNWVGTSHTAVVGGVPTFTADQGFDGFSTADYVQTLNPTAATNFVQNSATIGLYSRTGGWSQGWDAGAQDGTNYTQIKCSDFNSEGLAIFAINNTNVQSNGGNQPGNGLYVASRTSSTQMDLYVDGADVSTDTATSTGVPNATIMIGGLGTTTGIELISERQHAMLVVASGWTAQQNADFHTAALAYLTSFGAN